MPLTTRLTATMLALSLMFFSGAAQAETLEEANDRIDRDLAQVEGCQTLFDVSVLRETQLEIVLEASCRPSEPVTLDHGAFTLRLTTSQKGRLSAQIPMLDPMAAVTVTFADGMMESQMPPVDRRRAEATPVVIAER